MEHYTSLLFFLFGKKCVGRMMVNEQVVRLLSALDSGSLTSGVILHFLLRANCGKINPCAGVVP